MAYFRENEMDETRKQPLSESGADYRDAQQEYSETPEYLESDYDDGFDDPEDAGDEDEELSEEEKKEIRRKRFRMMSGAGNLTAVIAGTVVILVLLALLMSMVGFVLNDVNRNFTLLQTKF